MKDLTVIAPIYNEEEVLPALFERLHPALSGIDSYEILFVDDGSTDGSRDIIIAEVKRHPGKIKYVRFSRNFGHQTAVTAGLKYSTGKAVVIIDADLQDPPEIINEFMEKWREGYKVVYAIRKKRKEGLFKKIAYNLYYRILEKISNIRMPIDAGDFCLMDRTVVDLINSFPERNRFVRGLRSWVGFKSIGIEYERSARFRGTSKYPFMKLIKLAFDGITGFSSLPLRASAYFGFIVAIFAFIFGIIIIVRKLFFSIDVAGWASLSVIIFFLSGVQLIVLGVLGEYLGRVYTEVQRRPQYIVEEEVGFNK